MNSAAQWLYEDSFLRQKICWQLIDNRVSGEHHVLCQSTVHTPLKAINGMRSLKLEESDVNFQKVRDHKLSFAHTLIIFKERCVVELTHNQRIPFRQYKHAPHATTCSDTTESPISTACFAPAPFPNATTMPVNSCPGTTGVSTYGSRPLSSPQNIGTPS
jgi:hypothetical protein